MLDLRSYMSSEFIDDALIIDDLWRAPGSEDTKLGVLMGPEVSHGEETVYARVQA